MRYVCSDEMLFIGVNIYIGSLKWMWSVLKKMQNFTLRLYILIKIF